MHFAMNGGDERLCKSGIGITGVSPAAIITPGVMDAQGCHTSVQLELCHTAACRKNAVCNELPMFQIMLIHICLGAA